MTNRMHADIVVATTTRGDTTEKEGIHYNTEIMEEKMIVLPESIMGGGRL